MEKTNCIIQSDRPEAARRDAVGGKAAALAELARAGLPVPPWFVVVADGGVGESDPPRTACGFADGEADDDDRTAEESARAGPVAKPQAVRGGSGCLNQGLGAEARSELAQALSVLCPDGGGVVAVRSSARDEDGQQHSFAGQFDSFLFVSPDRVAEKVSAVWRSASSERVIAYRREHGLSEVPSAPAVLVQRMVNADAAGVAFAADPATGRRGVAVVAAVPGLGTSLVGGDADADTWHVDRADRIVHRAIATKRTAHRQDAASPEGVRAVDLPVADAGNPVLTDEQVLAVARLARQASRHFGRPQDIEWAIEGGRLWLLQSRPITTLANLPDPDGALGLWDNSNIVESYSGVTTPLTYSFARRAYEEVYRQFCRLMRVPRRTIDASDDVFRRMIGLVRGRVYYNLLSWYRLLAMLPGFKLNRRFMEQMMGVKEPLPDELVAQVIGSTGARMRRTERLRDTLALLGTVGGLVVNHFTLARSIRAFYRRLELALAPTDPPLGSMRADLLVAYFRSLEQQLLKRWDAPLVNDFFAMVFYGVLRGLCRKWLGDHAGTLQNDLIGGEGGMVSAEPAIRVKEMASEAARDPDFARILSEAPLADILPALSRRPAFEAQYRAYLEKFGDRCLEELKLESKTLHDDPLLLLRGVGRLAAGQRPREHATPASPPSPDPRARAEARVREALTSHPVRRAVFNWVLSNARARVRDRENLRFERTRLFGRVRRIFVELGRRLYAEGRLHSPDDVFYLEAEEVFGFIEGTTTTVAHLADLAALRRGEFTAYRDQSAPAERFETRGAVHAGNSFESAKRATPPADTESADRRTGIGCSPGVVTGVARVITDPRNAELPVGSILVARSTDPGWIMLFPAAAGLVVERGSLLSHSAIVAREMGIPAVVSLPDATTWLRDGDRVELDGATGIVRRLMEAGDAP